MEKLTLTLTLESPYTADGEPRADLPTGEVLAWDGGQWCNGWLKIIHCRVKLFDAKGIIFNNVLRFAPLPTIIEDESTIF